MKQGLDWATWGKKIFAWISKYKYVLLVMAAGVVLLLLPQTKENGKEMDSGEALSVVQEFNLQEMEQKMEEVLSGVEGAGEVQVILTIKGGTRRIIAQDIKHSERENSTETVIISKGSGMEEAVVLQQIYPQYQGALVVCQGGEDPKVQLKIMEAVSALTGLGADRISICKSK